MMKLMKKKCNNFKAQKRHECHTRMTARKLQKNPIQKKILSLKKLSVV